MESNQYVISSVEKSLNVLMLIAENGQMSIRELSKVANINKSTLFRIIKTLETLDFLHLSEDEGYILGNKVHELTKYLHFNNDIKTKLKPFIKKIWHETEETVHLAIIENNEIVIIDMIEGTGALRVFSDIGTRLPIDYGNIGKVYNSFALEADDNIKEQGYSYSVDDPIELAFGIAVPILSNNKLVAVISLSGPNSRKNQANKDYYIQTLLEIAHEASQVF